MAQSGSIPYIGCRISLISKSGIRYEGFLFNIDTKESTVALQNVRSFGTEGRRKDGQDIPPSNNLYDYIIFRGSDIQDLKVCEAPPSASAPQPPPHDPAIINMGQQMGHPMYGGYPQMYPYPPYYPYPGYRGIPQQQRPINATQQPLHPQPVQNLPPQAHGQQAPNRRLNAQVAQRPTTHHAVPGDNTNVETTGAQNGPVVEQQEHEESEEKGSEQEDKAAIQDKEKAVPNTNEEAIEQPPADTQKLTNAASHAPTQPAGLTGWADAARGAKQKQSHGNSVQYGHARSNQAGERRSAAAARKQPQHRNAPRYRPAAPVPMTEFDFEKANSLFDKAKIKQELLRGTEENQGSEQGDGVVAPTTTPLPTKSYDKNASFFDSLSCDSLTEDGGEGGKRSYAEQRRLNAETFGAHSLNDGRAHRGQNDRGGNRQQYHPRSNGSQGHGNYASRSHSAKRVFVPVHEQAHSRSAEGGKK